MLPSEPSVPLTPALAEFWDQALSAHPELDRNRLTGVFAFDDNPEGAAFCAAAVVSGEKTATSALAAEFGPDHPAPRPGDLEIVTEFDGAPRAVIAYTAIDRIRLGDVDEAFARAEGDGTLAAWRRTHLRYYGDRCADLGTRLTGDTELLRLFFRRVHP